MLLRLERKLMMLSATGLSLMMAFLILFVFKFFGVGILGEINTFLLHPICKAKRAALSALHGQRAVPKKSIFFIFQIK